MGQNSTENKIMGWLGSIALAVCAAPQAWLIWQQGHAHGMSGLSIGLWVFGEACLVIYIWPSRNWPLLVNYIFNLLLLSVIVYYYIAGAY